MKYEICGCQERDFDAIFKINKESNLFATAQFMTSPRTIEKTMKNKKKLFLVARNVDTGETVGYILGKMKTRGVFYNELLGVIKEHRRRGVGGALIGGLLRLIDIKKISDVKNPFWGWKWFADVPSYNFDALQMYKALKFDVEGIMKKHTSAKTDVYILSFFHEEMKLPEYGEHLTKKIAEFDDSTLISYLSTKIGAKDISIDERSLMDML